MKEIISTIDLSVLKNRSDVKVFPTKRIIIKEGSTEPSSMYIILSGKVDVWASFNSAQRAHLATLEPGAFFGEMSLFLNEPRSATVIAASDVTLLELTPDNAMDILKKNPELPYALLGMLCKRIQQLNKRVKDTAGV